MRVVAWMTRQGQPAESRRAGCSPGAFRRPSLCRGWTSLGRVSVDGFTSVEYFWSHLSGAGISLGGAILKQTCR